MHGMSRGSVAPIRTSLLLFWSFATLAWSIFNPPAKTFAARILLLQPAWLVRAIRHDFTWRKDLLLFQIVHAIYSHRSGAWCVSTSLASLWLDLQDRNTQIYLQVFPLLGLCAIFAGGIAVREHHLKSQDRKDQPSDGRMIVQEQLLPPLLIPSRTTHTRLFPKKHAFTYSYLFVGVPVALQGRVGNLLSVNSGRKAWYHIDPADHLDRGSAWLTLAQKLKRYLHTQGVTDRDYAFAYLVTAPRFLGYSFNPVSFWYLYDSDARLSFMVLEVNNTFGERRMYLLRPHQAKTDSDIDAAFDSNGSAGSKSKKAVFAEVWEKDFHVSPFNSRKGSYSLRATDPLASYEEDGEVQIDNTIVLRSSKEHAKIVARVWSEGVSRHPDTMTPLDTLRFIVGWSWVGFATLPRIVWEASKLSFNHSLHVWYRPEVTTKSVGRDYNDDERTLEAFFRAFLTQATTNASRPLRVTYEPAHSAHTEIVLYSPDFTYEDDQTSTLTIKVLSPAFYSRFVHYAHASEAFDRECLTTSEENRTVSIEPAELLPALLEAVRYEHDSARDKTHSTLDQVRWSCLRRLRCPPALPSYPHSTEGSIKRPVKDISPSSDSEMDRFVAQRRADGDIYRRIVTKLFMAERFAFGIPVLLVSIDWFVRASMLFGPMVYSDRPGAVDILRRREYDVSDALTVTITMGLANLVHLWSWVKG